MTSPNGSYVMNDLLVCDTRVSVLVHASLGRKNKTQFLTKSVPYLEWAVMNKAAVG